jgi:hypothetical protein
MMETAQAIRSRRFSVHFQLLCQLFQKVKGLACGLKKDRQKDRQIIMRQ